MGKDGLCKLTSYQLVNLMSCNRAKFNDSTQSIQAGRLVSGMLGETLIILCIAIFLLHAIQGVSQVA